MKVLVYFGRLRAKLCELGIILHFGNVQVTVSATPFKQYSVHKKRQCLVFSRSLRKSDLYGQLVLRRLPSGGERKVLHPQVLRQVLLQVVHAGGPTAVCRPTLGCPGAAAATLPSHSLTPYHHSHIYVTQCSCNAVLPTATTTTIIVTSVIHTLLVHFVLLTAGIGLLTLVHV